MDSWANGAKASEVQRVINGNFDTLDRRTNELDRRMLELDRITEERNATYIKDFVVSEWVSGIIPIKQSEYNKTIPRIELYIKNEDGYSIVYGGYEIKNYGVELQSDIPYEGRVVIR